MRALVVALVCLVSIVGVAAADLPPPNKKRMPPISAEAQSVKDWFEQTHAAPDKAVTRLAKSVQQSVALRPATCIKKIKATVADDKTKKAFVKCLGEWAELANFDRWESRTRDNLPDDVAKFAKKLPKDAKLVMGGHSDGFVLVALGAGKDGEWPIIAIYVDLSAAE